MEPISGIFTFAKIGLLLLQIANRFLEKADQNELRQQGFKTAVAEVSAKTVNVVGISAAAFGRVAGWTDDQIIDDLTKPPAPRSSL